MKSSSKKSKPTKASATKVSSPSPKKRPHPKSARAWDPADPVWPAQDGEPANFGEDD